ncbi:MAG: hypothetical protein H6601_04660 [Flavobacteriales bacterium]|nr:hypothetical protein [Flavobacteriales bacterium]
MKRRGFIKKAAAATAGAFAVPYILPSGRLFAATGAQLAEHVVMVMFAGGVRHQESVGMNYLDQSQGIPIEGNIMYNMLDGAPPTQKIVYGTDGNLSGDTPIPQILGSTIQQQGTLFKEVRSSHAGHYGGMNALLQGNTLYSQGLRQKPLHPTIFEYTRRHLGAPASKVWFVGNGIGNSTPLMNYSEHPDYGAEYGANFLAPTITFGSQGVEHLSDAKIYHPEEELDPIYQMKYFLDNNFENVGGTIETIHNTEEEKQQIKDFLKDLYGLGGNIAKPPVTDNGDLNTVGYTVEVMKRFKPNLTVVNLSAVDACHSDYTGYLSALHRADHAVGHLWNQIQQIPEMAGNTVMLVTPECGRNLNPNPIKDENDWYAFDHSDANTQRVFTQMVGPSVPSNLVIGDTGNQIGETADNCPTIAEILGFKDDVMGTGLISSTARSLFDRI